MKSLSPVIMLLCCIWAASPACATQKLEQRKPASGKQTVEALLGEQARLRQLLEIQHRQLQDMSNRFNTSRSSEPISNVPYTYP